MFVQCTRSPFLHCLLFLFTERRKLFGRTPASSPSNWLQQFCSSNALECWQVQVGVPPCLAFLHCAFSNVSSKSQFWRQTEQCFGMLASPTLSTERWECPPLENWRLWHVLPLLPLLPPMLPIAHANASYLWSAQLDLGTISAITTIATDQKCLILTITDVLLYAFTGCVLTYHQNVTKTPHKSLV